MLQPFRSMSARTSRTASGIVSSGMAYSISRKRTGAVLVNTAGEKSVKSRLPVSLSVTRARCGAAAGTARADHAGGA